MPKHEPRTSPARRNAAATLLCCLVLASVPFAPPFTARAQRRTIDTYAITNARILTGTTNANSIIERGTVVIRNGLIQAVGANVAAPADARIIDGAGLSVYPGLVDAHTSLGIPAQTQTGGARTTPASVPPALTPATPSTTPAAPRTPPQNLNFIPPGESPAPGLQPETLASEQLRVNGEGIDAARNAGITAALTAPREGIFIGQSAFVNLAGDTVGELIVRSPVALHVGFTPVRGGTFPSSLMGVFAAMRQMLLDAQRYRETNAIYERNPRGLPRPVQSQSLAALQPVLAGEMPVVMNANTEREINRALDLAREFNLRVIIAGGAESYKVTSRLREANASVLLSLNFSRRTTAAAPDADPEPLRILRERVEAPKTPAKLAAAGVRFAFQSGALTNMTDFIRNAAKTIENGLPRDEALRAMTLRPAEIFNLADRLGTIEPGKIANLTVTRGDLFNRDSRIAYVFIDGRQVDLKPATTVATSGAGAAAGVWNVQIKIGELPEIPIQLNLRQEGDRLGGAISGELGSSEIANASLEPGGAIRFTVPVTFSGEVTQTQTTEATFNGTLTGNTMRGSVEIINRGSGTFTATRSGDAPPTPNAAPGATPQTPPSQAAPPSAANLTGTWSINVETNEGTVPATLQLQQQGATLTGAVQSQFGPSEITNGSAANDGFRFTIVLTVQGQTFDVTFNGAASSGDEIRGTVATPQGTFPFTGTRSGA